jgi:diguanylate cyclase (GGDEF)-like protein
VAVTDSGREITSIMPLMTLAYVRRAVGDDAVAEVLNRAGVSADDPRLATEEEWVPLGMAAAIAAAAADICREPAIGQRIGDQYFLHHQNNGVSNFLLAEGTPAAALDLAVSFASRMSASRQFHIVETSDTRAIIEGRPGVATGPSRFFCEMAATYFGRIPSMFGAPSSVVHGRCIDAGDPCCELVVRWDRPVELLAEDAELRRGIADEAIARFEDFQAMSAELAEADDVHTVLERVVRRLSIAVMAPRFLISVEPRVGDQVEVASVGFDDTAAVGAASAALWAGTTTDTTGLVLSAPIASAHRHYGYLAAYLPDDAVQLHIDERLLHAYAGHATSAVERAVSIEDARRSHQTATALLALAGSLAAATTVEDVCRQLAAAVPDVAGSDVGAVWLWDAPSGTFRLHGWTESWLTPVRREIRAEELLALAHIADDPRPIVLDVHDEDPLICSILEEWGVHEGYAAPILLRGEFLGFVTAASTTPTATDAARAWVLERLGALADHASTALDSSMLLEQIRHQALHDALTGLPNRSLAETRAQEALAAARRSGDGVALLFVDLDRFKNVNDTLGHSAGDELIRQVAGRLAACVGTNGIVARLGGDEFFVLLPSVHAAATAVAVADAIIESVRQPFEVSGRPLYISASVGIACYPDHGPDYMTLMRHADAAMYQAKAYGRSTYAVHTDGFSTERRARLQLESELHLALERDELVVHYQPQVDLLTDRVVGVEALVRWQHPTHGLVGPDAFLSIAEDSGVIVDIDAWVRRRALTQAKVWCDAGLELRMALNLSTRDLRKPDIVDDLRGVIESVGVRADLVELEITDRVVMSNDDLPQVMDHLRTLGTRLAIDDFGTGNSVLSRLQHCPVDVLKIDRTFINELHGEHADARLVNALISMAHALGLSVVGEGVETEVQADILRRYGCDVGQGFLWSRAVLADQIEELVARTAPVVNVG